MEKMNKKQFEAIRDLMRNGVPEWLILYLTVKYKGTVSNRQIGELLNDNFGWNFNLSRLSQARNKLRKNGLKATISYGKHYELSWKLQEQYERLFSTMEEIIRILDEERIAEIKKVRK